MNNLDSVSSDALAVLIAGIGGGSLGLEIFKSLRHAGGYRLIGTDVSERAYGLYEEGFQKTFLLQRTLGEEYALQLLDICLKENVDAIAPGAEEVHTILSKNRALFQRNNILLMLNSEGVVDLCSDKTKTLKFLEQNGVPVPCTMEITSEENIRGFTRFPCVVKPAVGAGGSNMVFVAEDEEEATFFVRYLHKRGFTASLQEYIASNEEYTVGVLSEPSGEVVGSVALKRSHEQKLSCALKYNDIIISSGWSQGVIDDFDEVRQQAERIAQVLKSKWALNIQGRLDKQGIFYPFEVNPRHSGTTYLRALAGFNEPHILLQRCLVEGYETCPQPLKKGYYLRSFAEKYISPKSIRTHD